MTIEEIFNLAAESQKSGDFAQAAELYGRILAVDPNQANVWHLLGLVRFQLGDMDQAVGMIGRAIQINPANFDFHYNLGLVHVARQKPVEAAAEFRKAAALGSSRPGAMVQVANALSQLRLWGEALEICRAILAEKPDDADALSVYAKTMLAMGDFGAAMETYRRILKLRPDDAWAHCNLGQILLQTGQLKEGWREFEWRFALPGGTLDRKFPQPRWDGGDVSGKALLVHTEGGYGDAIQYARFVPMLRGRAGRIILECAEALVPLFESLAGVDQIVARGKPLPRFDVHIPFPSLPAVFGTELGDLPGPVPYLKVPAERMSQWSGRVPSDNLLNVGLVWSGNRESSGEGRRTSSLESLAPLSSVAGVRFFSLQLGKEAAQPRPKGWELIDLTGAIRDFADTAVLVSRMDLVISVDTSVAHLAGALAVPVWVLVSSLPDYRWMLERTDSPWYPTMKLFRRPAVDDWETPIARMTGELSLLAKKRG